MNWLERLNQTLPALAQKAGRERLASLARKLEENETNVPEQAAHPDCATPLRLLVLLGEEIRETQLRHQRWRDTLAAGRAFGQETGALREVLTQAATGGALAADLQALDRHLESSAIGDRCLLEAQDLSQQWQFLAQAVAHWGCAAAPTDLAVGVRNCALDLLADMRHHWSLRATACTLLASLESSGGAGSAGTGQALLERACDASDQIWVQVAALEAWCRLDRSRAETTSLLRATLLRVHEEPTLHTDHRLLRARAAALAATGGHHEVLLEALERRDPSEHTRCALVRAVAQQAMDAPDAVLQALLPMLAHDPSRVVRATAVVASLPTGPGKAAAGAPWVELVGAALADRTDPWVVETVLDSVWNRLEAGWIAPADSALLTAGWDPGLRAWSARPRHPDLAQLAMALRLRLQVAAAPRLQAASAQLEAWLATCLEGDSTTIRTEPLASLSGGDLLDVMAVSAFRGMDLSADPLGTKPAQVPFDLAAPGQGWRLYCGERVSFRTWRWLYELKHPRPDKRQAWDHTTDRAPPGALVAPSGRMAEVTPTAVPGQRGATPTRAWWGQELPLPSQILAACRPGGISLRLVSQRLRISPRRGALSTAIRVQRRYAALDHERNQLLRGELAEAMPAWDAHLGNLGVDVERQALGLGAGVLFGGMDDLLRQLASTESNTVPQLALVAGAWGAWWVGRDLWRAHQARAWRNKVPLIVGGWGSRGKSGTERIKAALFHGLGYTVLSKTTGSEAMVVCSIPGGEAHEIYLYRPYDKATIVEQRNVLKLAAELGVQVMLWECMALNPIYVEILQQGWMKDDITTITNTYPDHEDIQGPTGREVAETIARVIPRGGTVITTEQHMTPVLEQRARVMGSHFASVWAEEWRLLPSDLLERFPYAEHPRNIALAVRLAQQLEVPADLALTLMAEHVVPDIGVLKEYGPASYEGRTVSFVNGMAANERAGFLSNWDRMGFTEFEPEAGLADHVVVMVNNRADRLPRQSVFASIGALDAMTDALAVIGTNVGPFRDEYHALLQSELRPQLLRLVPTGAPTERRRLVAEMGRRIRRHPLDEPTARGILARLLPEELDALEHTLQACYTAGRDPADASKSVMPAPLADLDETGLDRLQAGRQWLQEVSWLWLLQQTDDWDVTLAVDTLVMLLARRIVPLLDPGLSGDQVLHRIALLAPPGARQRVLGCANIKGTGMGWVYRWLSLQKVLGWTAALSSDKPTVVQATVRALSEHRGYGVADTALALAALAEAERRGQMIGLEAQALAARERLSRELRHNQQALSATGERSPMEDLRDWAQASFDVRDGIARRSEAEALYTDLAQRRVGMERAAKVAKGIVGRQKK